MLRESLGRGESLGSRKSPGRGVLKQSLGSGECPGKRETLGKGKSLERGKSLGKGESLGRGESPGSGESPRRGVLREPGEGGETGGGESLGRGVLRESLGKGESPGKGDSPGKGESPGMGESPGKGESPGRGERLGRGESLGKGVPGKGPGRGIFYHLWEAEHLSSWAPWGSASPSLAGSFLTRQIVSRRASYSANPEEYSPLYSEEKKTSSQQQFHSLYIFLSSFEARRRGSVLKMFLPTVHNANVLHILKLMEYFTP